MGACKSWQHAVCFEFFAGAMHLSEHYLKSDTKHPSKSVVA